VTRLDIVEAALCTPLSGARLIAGKWALAEEAVAGIEPA
jgi:hypothetical protein